MTDHKKPREMGKFSFAKFFQSFKEGDTVAVVRDLTFPFFYRKQTQGRTGKVISQKGSQYEVEIKDLNKPKRYYIHPVHLKRITHS
jgi:ribosomal protein L21E